MVNDSEIVSRRETIDYFVNDITAVKGAAITVASGGVMQGARINAGARLTVNANASAGHGYIYGEEIIKGRGYDETIYSGGRQTILQGGSASFCNVEKGGVQLVSAGGSALGSYIKGAQTIYSGGQAQYATVSSGGRQTILKGGLASNCYVEKGGAQIVSAQGTAQYSNIRGSQTVYSGGLASATTVSSGGRQTILRGGRAEHCHVEKGGVQIVSAGASSINHSMWGKQIVNSGAVVSQVSMFGSQILSGGMTLDTGIYSGGRQTILKGGLASDCSVEKGCVQLVSAGGSAKGSFIWGSQTVYSGGLADQTFVSSGGRQTILRGGLASHCNIDFQGVQIISAQGTAKNSYVSGAQTVARGGIASNCDITAGGSQTVLAGGKAIGTTMYASGASLTLAGTASGATIGWIGNDFNPGCVITIKKGGVARNTLLGGKLIVASGGAASATTIVHGAMTISRGGAARGVEMYSGELNVLAGASVSNIRAEYPSYSGMYKATWNNISFGKNITLGGANKFRCATVSASGALTVKSGSTLTLHNASMLGFTTNAAGAAINIRGHDNKVLAFGKVNAKTALNFDLTKDSLIQSRMADHPDLLTDTSRQYQTALTVSNKQSYNGKVSISVNGLQILGAYQLCDGLNFKKNASVSVKMNGKSVGALKVGGTLRKNGVSYQLSQTNSGQYKLNMTAIAGAMRKGTAKNETLTGGANCDIFYGGAGKDVIKGVNGHDVVYYDTKKWGKDTIAATNGSVTLYMAGLNSNRISTAKKGKDLVITRNGIAGDSITIKNYDENRHNIIYGGALGKFSKYLNTAKPAAAIETAGREALWKKTGLLA